MRDLNSQIDEIKRVIRKTEDIVGTTDDEEVVRITLDIQEMLDNIILDLNEINKEEQLNG
jgi:hypothetical protein